MLEKEEYFTLTGNPFVDGGIYAIEAYYGKDLSSLKPEDLKKKTDALVDLYLTDGWKKNMFSVFTGNSKFTNPLIKNKKEAALNYLNGLLKEFTPPKKNGSCVACGRREALPLRKRDEIPLTGSGNFVNFFSGFSQGERYCSVCTFAVQFIPLMLYSVGNRFMLIHAVSEKIMKYWAMEAIKNVNEQVSSGNYTGCMQEGYKVSKNALFHIIEKIIRDIKDIYPDENPSITAYVFSNYGQNPAPMDIIHLPNNIFKFLVYIQRLDSSCWRKIVNKGYRNIKKDDDYKVKRNSVYENLLENRSIIEYFFEKKRNILGNWEIFSFYLKEVKKMDEKRIDVLKKVGDKIANYITRTDNTKRLYSIETAKTYEGLRNVFLKITKDLIAEGINPPLFTTDEFLNQLFPEGALSWKETRDILLFRIYEKLSEYLMNKKEIIKEINEEEE